MTLFRLYAGVGDHLAPLVELHLDEIAELIGRRGKALEADIAESRLGRRIVNDLADRAVELGDHRGRGFRRRDEAGPSVDLKSLNPGFVERRQIREQRG